MFFSIIICTYNPDVRLLKRAMNSIIQLVIPDVCQVECIIIDNNSTNNFSNDIEIKSLMSKFRLIMEPRQGLSNARIKGVDNANGDIIIFVDDDNELAANYLIGLKCLFEQYQQVAVWGPGIINVDFIDGADSWIVKNMRGMFQYRQNKQTRFGSEQGWPNYYPAGSGLVIKKNVFELYQQQYKEGKLTITGRKGEDLSSGEDSQIIWTAVKNGMSVGTSDLLSLNHIITKQRTSLEYIVKLNFNIAYSFYQAQYEIFSNQSLLNLSPNILTKVKLFVKTLIKCKFDILTSTKIFKVENAWYKGYMKFYNEFLNTRI